MHIKMSLSFFSNLYSLIEDIDLLGVIQPFATDLYRTKYSYSLSILLKVLAMEVLNADSRLNRSDVSCEGCGVLGPQVKDTIVHTPSVQTTTLQNLCIKWKGSSQIDSRAFTMHHLNFDIKSFVFQRGSNCILRDFLFFERCSGVLL